MLINVPSLSASARSSGRVEKRWQSFLNYQPSTTKLAAAQGPTLAQTPDVAGSVQSDPGVARSLKVKIQENCPVRVVILAAAALLVAIAVRPVRADDGR
jgi:hypothetical protein